jgi:glycerophosphoryl diester phosphodiesterase
MALLTLVALLTTACSMPAEPVAQPDSDAASVNAEPATEPELRPTPTPVPLPPASEPPLPEGLKLLAHRGVHHTFDGDDIDDQTCTATRIDLPEHSFFENTLASMEAAFVAGAAVVEIDIAPSSDGVLAVFHDWEVDCRTDGSGAIRSLSWDELSGLDIGYGYTADGETYPLRGQGQGLMPRLEEVFAAFPNGRFLINFKSGDPADFGADDPIAACDNTILLVPLNIAVALPGWPDTFVATMLEQGTDVIIAGPGLDGIDTQDDLDLLPDLDVFVRTNKVEALTPP